MFFTATPVPRRFRERSFMFGGLNLSAANSGACGALYLCDKLHLPEGGEPWHSTGVRCFTRPTLSPISCGPPAAQGALQLRGDLFNFRTCLLPRRRVSSSSGMSP